ncbi:UbiD family decarboxylase [Rhodoplanes sp. Z2-YC6860]|nr:UbiD family decarboxylase [Rhodoplanes sp. Z2-YC6860]
MKRRDRVLYFDLKHVVVGEDVGIHNATEVERAVAARSRPTAIGS